MSVQKMNLMHNHRNATIQYTMSNYEVDPENLMVEYPYLDERGITPEIIDEFGLGIDMKSSMKNRLAIPVHNKNGELVAYYSRYIGNDIPKDEPKYEQTEGFRKEFELFNLHRLFDGNGYALCDHVIMVESFFSVFKLHTIDYCAISPMGRSVSDIQIELLKKMDFPIVVLLFDGDNLGCTTVTTIGRQLLASGFHVVAPILPKYFKPHCASNRELKSLIRQII